MRAITVACPPKAASQPRSWVPDWQNLDFQPERDLNGSYTLKGRLEPLFDKHNGTTALPGLPLDKVMSCSKIFDATPEHLYEGFLGWLIGQTQQGGMSHLEVQQSTIHALFQTMLRGDEHLATAVHIFSMLLLFGYCLLPELGIFLPITAGFAGLGFFQILQKCLVDGLRVKDHLGRIGFQSFHARKAACLTGNILQGYNDH